MSQKFTLQCHTVPKLMQTRTHSTQVQSPQSVPQAPTASSVPTIYRERKKEERRRRKEANITTHQHIPVFVCRTLRGLFLDPLFKENWGLNKYIIKVLEDSPCLLFLQNDKVLSCSKCGKKEWHKTPHQAWTLVQL